MMLGLRSVLLLFWHVLSCSLLMMHLTAHSCCTCPFWQDDAWTPFHAPLACSLLFSADDALDNAFVLHLACSLLFRVDYALDSALVLHVSVLAG